jgi:hypothetical protein
VHINRAWETVTENIKISVKGSLGYYVWYCVIVANVCKFTALSNSVGDDA